MGLPQTGLLSADTTGLVISGRPSNRSSLPATFAVWGGGGNNFGSGTAKLQAGFVDSAGATKWMDIPDTSFTADGLVNIAMRANYFRLVLSGSTAPTLRWWFG